MDTWLRDHLIANGTIAESGSSRRAKPRRCPRCNAHIIQGDDAAHGAVEEHADPVPLTTLGEVLALAEGRRTVDLVIETGKPVLHYRDPHHIAGLPAGAGPRRDTLRTHQCGTEPPTGPLVADTTLATPRRATTGEGPDF